MSDMAARRVCLRRPALIALGLSIAILGVRAGAYPMDYAPLKRVHARFVTAGGLVDYAGLKKDPSDLLAFLKQAAKRSPLSDPGDFRGRNAALAYWINAYNAWMMKAVIDAYPVGSVNDIGKNPTVFDARGRVCGGADLSLNEIEQRIVRKQFLEPRVHFALNCASMGCPWLPREPYDPARLDAQLDRDARRFFAIPERLSVDFASRTVSVSPILQWYRDDFLAWLTKVKGIRKPTILDFVKLYAPGSVAGRIGPTYRLKTLEYDWRLTDSRAAWAGKRG